MRNRFRSFLSRHREGTATKPAPPSIVGVFRDVARANPQKVAVRTVAMEMTYRELDARSDQLARTLLDQLPDAREGEEVPIALVAGQDEEAVIGILGILKADRPFVHLSTGDSPERRRIIIETAGFEIFVTGNSAVPGLPSPQTKTGVRFFSIPTRVESGEDSEALPPPRGDRDFAVVFTSGQSGNPTGVWRSQSCKLEHARFLSETCEIGPGTRIGSIIPCSFGAALNDLFLALLNGASFCPFPFASEGIPHLLRWLEAAAIQYLHLAPSVLRSMMATDLDPEKLPALRWLKVGGEPFHGSDLLRFRESFGKDCRILLSYGASETGGSISARILDGNTPTVDGPLAVGKPLPGKTVEIVDAAGNPVTGSNPGEIAVTASHLASGYYRDPEKSAERFLEIPGRPGFRRFLTRDRGHWDAEGNLCHTGRLDAQVKINGIRINPSGVESLLRSHPAIADAAVVPVGIRHPQLSAFLVASHSRSKKADPDELREYLAERLPRHSVPRAYRFLQSLPRRDNGKTDRDQLVTWSRENPKSPPSDRSVAPRDSLESLVAQIWTRQLGLEHLDIYEDFFDIGGDSLAAVNFQAELSRQLGMEVPVAVMLGEHPTVAHVSEQIRHFHWGSPPPEADPIESLQTPFSSLVQIREGGGDPPIFFFPGGYGSETELMLFARIASSLPGDRPIYGFRATTLYQYESPPQSLSEVARIFLQESADKFQGTRPFLVGNCIAGMVAFEMACRLERERDPGEHPHLILIESAPRRGWRRKNRGDGDAASRSQDPEFARFYLDLFEGHVPGHYGGPIDLLVGPEYRDPEDPTLGWRNHTGGAIEIHPLRGDHFEAVRRFRDDLGSQLARVILERSPPK